MPEEESVVEEKVFRGCDEHGAPKAMNTGLLLAILLVFGVLGALYGHSRVPGTPYMDDGWEDTLGLLIFTVVLLPVLYVGLSRYRNSKVVHPVFKRDNSFYFRTADFEQDHVERMKIRRSLFSDLVSVRVQLKNGGIFQYTCPREMIQEFTDRQVPYKVDHRLNRLWPLYVFYLLLAFDYGMFLSSGKSFFLSLFQYNS